MEPSGAVELEAFLEGERARGTFPSYQALVITGETTLLERSAGLAVVEPEAREATLDTLYDLASLTKPLLTALLALRLAEEGVIALEQPVSRLLEPMCEPPRERVTALDLLTHRAGFHAWAPLYLDERPSLERFARRAARSPLEYEPGKRVVYSDLGFLVLGAYLEAATGRPFAELARKGVLDPLGAEGLAFPPGPELRPGCAASERGNRHEGRLAGLEPSDPRLRHAMIWGEVHDGNAHALGGTAPHAGLFGHARAVARLARQYLEGGTLLGPAVRALALADLTPTGPQRRSAAWELAASQGSAGDGVLPPDAVGHSGFTGTSAWLEPRRGRIYVLLTNRVHPEARDVNMNAVRRRFHLLASRLAG